MHCGAAVREAQEEEEGGAGGRRGGRNGDFTLTAGGMEASVSFRGTRTDPPAPFIDGAARSAAPIRGGRQSVGWGGVGPARRGHRIRSRGSWRGDGQWARWRDAASFSFLLQQAAGARGGEGSDAFLLLPSGEGAWFVLLRWGGGEKGGGFARWR